MQNGSMAQDDPIEDLRRFLFLFGIIATLIVSAVGALFILPGNFHKPLFSYLNDLRAGNSTNAYEALCTESKQAMSLELFRARFDEQMRDIGAITRFHALRASEKLGSVVVTGSQKTVQALTPMRKEGGQWRPCPTAGPLGELKPWP